MSLGNLVANLGVNRRAWSGGLQGAAGDLRKFAGGITSILGPVAGIVGGALAAGSSLSAAKTQIDAERKLAAVLKATGGAAGLSAKEIQKFAGELQTMTNFSDEATINGAAILGTFKEIRGDVFKDAIVSIQDMAAVMGSDDLKGGAIQLGKALNDPIKGVSALADVGVSFTDEQRNMIRTLQESGDMMGAQRVILDELKGEFGGAAAAMADPMTQAANVLGDVAEIVGFVLKPSIDAVASAFSDSMGPLTNNVDTYKALGESIASVVSTAIVPLAEITSSAMSAITTGADLFGYAFLNAGDLAQLAMIEVSEGLLGILPVSDETSAAIASGLIGAFSATKDVTANLFEGMIGGLKELWQMGEAVASAIWEAFAAIARGENPLTAFSDKFVETLANQKDVIAPDIAAIASESYQQASNAAKQSIESSGGVGGFLDAQRQAIQERLAARERPGANTIETPGFVVPTPTDQATAATGANAPTGPAGLLRGSQEFLERIRQRDLKGSSESQKKEESEQKQLKAQQAVEKETKQQTLVLRRIADNLSIESGGFL